MSNRLSGYEVTLVAVLGAANFALNRLVPQERSREIPANVAATAALLALAHAVGSPDEEREELSNWRQGVKVGLCVGAPIGTALTLAPLIPQVRHFFHDERIARALPDEASYQFFARIPIATALCEELIFRMAVPIVLRRQRTRFAADLIGAALFGLWHVLPTLDRMHSNPGTASVHRNSPAGQAAVVAGTVAATAVAGFGLSKLRRAAGSIAAPIIVHAAINGGGFLGGWLSSRRQDPS